MPCPQNSVPRLTCIYTNTPTYGLGCRIPVALSERLLQRCRTLNYGEGIRDLVRGPNPIINRSITHGLHPSQRVQSSAKVRFS